MPALLLAPAEPDPWASPDLPTPPPYPDGEFAPTLADLHHLCPRLAERLVVDPDTGCWLWPGAHVLAHRNRRTRYGRIWWRGRAWLVHRLAHTLLYGSIPPGHEVHHHCNTTLCCNPAHIEPVDADEHAWIHAEAESYAAD